MATIKKVNISNYNPEVTGEELSEIIKFYATEICLLWEYYRQEYNLIRKRFILGEIPNRMAKWQIDELHKRFGRILSKLLIEQFYNTLDDNLFDSAVMVNEEIELNQYSYIDKEEMELVMSGDAGNDDFVIFYKGFFFNITEPESSESAADGNYKIIIRDEDNVKRINRKLSRARGLLATDEYSLGRKYYQGLCERSHYTRR